MKNYVQKGDVIEVVAGGTINAGDVVRSNAVVGIAVTGAANGETVAVAVSGVFEVTKKTTDVVALGAALYWDPVASEFTVTSTNNVLAGWAWNAAGNGVTKVQIKLQF